MNITDLTEDVLLVMIEFMSVKDRLHLKSASMKINTETRNQLGYLSLNERFTRKYVYSPKFREHVHSRIANPKLQLSLFCKCPASLFMNTDTLKLLDESVHMLNLNRTFTNDYRPLGFYKIMQLQCITNGKVPHWQLILQKLETTLKKQRWTENYAMRDIGPIAGNTVPIFFLSLKFNY